jgi:DNA-binding CsgD family transcriptional regulator/tetratricopeptide (TPR) repeat protein
MRATTTLLEREHDLDLLDDLLADIDSSGGQVVLVRGEAGIGKSSLVREFISTHEEDSHVLIGWCDDLSTPQPFGPFWDIARSEHSLTGPLEDAGPRELFGAVMDLFSRTLRPTIVVLEDTQWADEATLDAIRYVGRRIERSNGLLILTYRDGDVDFDHPLRGVIGDLPPASVARIRLEALSAGSVAEMLRGSELDADEIIAVTDGNPFLVTQIALAGGDVIPSSVQDSVVTRVRKLSPEAQELLRLLSVIPERIPRLDILELAAEMDGALAEAERRGLLDDEGGFVAFRHDLIRQAVESTMTTAETVARNLTVLEALPPDTDPARLVHHAEQANDVLLLVDLAPRAAAAAFAVGSYREARDHFRHLSHYLDRIDSDLKGPILDQWAEAERFTGNYDEAIRLNEMAITHARDLHDRSSESKALTFAALYRHRTGQGSAAKQYAREAVDVLGPEPDDQDLARALEISGYLAMMDYDSAATLLLVEETLEVAGPNIDERILIRSLIHRGIAMNHTNYPEGLASLNEARTRAEAAGYLSEMIRAIANAANCALEARDMATAMDYMQMARTPPGYDDEAEGNPYIAALHSSVLELKGDWSAAEHLASESRDSGDQLFSSKLIATTVLGAIDGRRGRSNARASVHDAWERAVAAGAKDLLTSAGAVLAEYGWISGDADIPISEIKEAMAAGIDVGLSWNSGNIALWLWKLGKITDAPDGIAEPYRLTIEGESIAAAEQWAEIGFPYEEAIALAHGDQTARLEALIQLETLGADAVAAKLRQELRTQGVAVPSRRSPKAADHGARLTARQAEVLSLLAERRSNAEIADQLFLSPRTVEHHVAAVMSKLDASSRKEAVEAATHRGLLDRDVIGAGGGI